MEKDIVSEAFDEAYEGAAKLVDLYLQRYGEENKQIKEVLQHLAADIRSLK